MVSEQMSRLMHRVQVALPGQQTRQLELSRPRQFEGMRGEVLKDVWNKQLSKSPDGVVRTLILGAIAGATWTADRAHRRGLRTTAHCLYCESSIDEGKRHLLWKCSAWQVVRDPMVLQLVQLAMENTLAVRESRGVAALPTAQLPAPNARIQRGQGRHRSTVCEHAIDHVL